jgi:hypothetical protein
MQHIRARQIIPEILKGSGFDLRSLALVDAAQLFEIPGIHEPTIDKAINATIALSLDEAPEPDQPLSGGPADTVNNLADWLLPSIIEHPQHTGRQIGTFSALAELWPHASNEERPQLAQRWYASLCQRRAPDDSYLPSETLCKWQSLQPTLNHASNPKATVIQSMLEEESAQDAYYVLASYLGTNMDLPTLTRIISALTVHVLLYKFDNKAFVLQGLAGILALHRMCDYARPDLLATLLGQLVHQIWWCRNSGRINRLEPGSSESMTLTDAVAAGDMTAARRAARIQAMDPDGFWNEINTLLDTTISNSHASWTRGLTAVRVLHQRAGGHGCIGPDDAAAIGATFAAIQHLEKHGTARFQRVV